MLWMSWLFLVAVVDYIKTFLLLVFHELNFFVWYICWLVIAWLLQTSKKIIEKPSWITSSSPNLKPCRGKNNLPFFKNLKIGKNHKTKLWCNLFKRLLKFVTSTSPHCCWKNTWTIMRTNKSFFKKSRHSQVFLSVFKQSLYLVTIVGALRCW